MNKTLISIGFFVLIAIGMVGAVVLIIYRPEELASFIGAITTLLGIGSAAVITIYGLGKQGEQLETIRANTNGTLSKLQEENARLTGILVARGLEPSQSAASPQKTQNDTDRP